MRKCISVILISILIWSSLGCIEETEIVEISMDNNTISEIRTNNTTSETTIKTSGEGTNHTGMIKPVSLTNRGALYYF